MFIIYLIGDGWMNISNKPHFYNKFINEENLKNINEGKIQKQFFNKTFLFYILSMTPIVEATFIGISFTHKFGFLIFIWCVVTELFALIVFLLLLKLEKQYSIFKKRLYFYLFYLSFVVISIAGIICAIFNTTYTSLIYDGFEVRFNPVYFFFLFLPLLLGDVIFSYYAYLKCFLLYAHEYYKNRKKD